MRRCYIRILSGMSAVHGFSPQLGLGPWLNYCTISFNSAHPCDCDTLDQFGTSTQMAGDCDKVKILTLDKAQIGSFEGLQPIRGRPKAARAKMYEISGK
jgi:hypothetical protein